MLTDILDETRSWEHRFVVTADEKVASLAESRKCLVVPEEHRGQPGLNAALALATEKAVSCGVSRLLVLPADVPAVSAADIEMLFSFEEPVVVAPSLDGGTAGLLRFPPAAIDTAFGPGSARLHLSAARQAGLKARFVEARSLLLDVDVPEDLEKLARMVLSRQSVQVARTVTSSRAPAARRPSS